MCPETTQDEMNAAAKSASEAFKTWKESSVLTRQAIMLKYQQKIKDNAVNLQYTVAYHDLDKDYFYPLFFTSSQVFKIILFSSVFH